MKKINKKFVTFGAILSVTAPAIAVVSCGNTSSFDKIDYDFGIAIPPINNLNYVKYDTAMKIMPTLIQGLITSGPGTALKNQLQLPQFTYGQMKKPEIAKDEHNNILGDEPSLSGDTGQRIYTLSDYNMFQGNLATASFLEGPGGRGTSFVAFKLNGVQKWKGPVEKYNRVITVQDYIDYVKYVMDLNTGSKRKPGLKETRISGLEDLDIAQSKYSEKFGTTYKNVWGVNVKITKDSNYASFNNPSFWPSQINGDKTYVEAIKKAALKFMLEGMRPISKGIDLIKSDSSSNGEIDHSSTDCLIGFENQTLPPAIVIESVVKDKLFPVNREFVESIGGIEKFGATFDKFQYTSPFDIADIRLGQGGYIDFVKDYNWPTASFTMSNKIKVYFNDQPNVLSAMFEDKYISATDIPAIFQSKFWGDPEIRQFMTKRHGFGTLALQMNLDKHTNGDSPLQNVNFRNAIAHAIDRSRLLQLLNWDSSFPITTWTPLGGTVKLQDGRSIDDFLSSQHVQGPYRSEPYSLTASSWMEHTGVQYKFEHTDRTDNRFNLDEARKYFDAWKQETGQSSATLRFLSADPTNLSAAQGIKSMLAQAFGNGVIDIEIKSVPKNTYETMRTSGQFDLTTFNFDQYGQSIDSYMKHLFFKDEINPAQNKDTGFIDNPTGSWTFYDWWSQIKNNPQEIQKQIKYLNIDLSDSLTKRAWGKIKEISKINPISDQLKLQDELNKIWSLSATVPQSGASETEIYSENQQIMFVAILEKIIALNAPIIPLLDVDNAWSVSRVYGLDSTYQYALQYAYDVLNKPDPSLPGKDVMINERS